MGRLTAMKRWLVRILDANAAERRRRRALRTAMWRFARLHPHWYDGLFDETFLGRLPAASLTEMDATALAREWTHQYRYRDQRHRERDVRQVAPVAESFLTLLATAEADLATAASLKPASQRAASHERPSRHEGSEPERRDGRASAKRSRPGSGREPQAREPCASEAARC